MKNCLTTYVANLSQMRNLVGDHILCGLQGVKDTNIDVSGNQETIWKYKALYHLIAEHSNGGILPEIPGELLMRMFIHKKKEQALGIEK
jgi:hypothetical protein